jgi:broad specificity phosphatase PhoE
MRDSDWIIPPTTLAWLEAVPRERAVAMLIRHSVRADLAPNEVGYTLPITADGHRLARQLGTKLRGRLRAVHASPLLRTVQTGERLAEGAGLADEVSPDRMLGDPGVFVVDDRADATWRSLGHEGVMRRLAEGREILPGCADADAAARALARHMLAASKGTPGIHAFVTHDSLITATCARLLGEPLTPADWPEYLEAAFFWEEGDGVHVRYRDRQRTLPEPLVDLTEAHVVALARREVGATLGLDCPARFFLAGGVFKTLLTGKPPRDLDIWAATPSDRALVEARLVERGAERLPERPYTQAFRMRGREIEVSLQSNRRGMDGCRGRGRVGDDRACEETNARGVDEDRGRGRAWREACGGYSSLWGKSEHAALVADGAPKEGVDNKASPGDRRVRRASGLGQRRGRRVRDTSDVALAVELATRLRGAC